MFEFLRKLFRRSPPPPKFDWEEAVRRRREILPCCGAQRYSHVAYRSGELKCPNKWRTPEGYIVEVKRKLDLRYNPLEVDECFYPPESELHFKCDRCGCPRGVHAFREDGKRGDCTDPDCPGCPGGLLWR